jgi:purine-cytosine permease-like protein
MPIEEVVNESTSVLTDVFLEVGRIGLWLQALGIVIVAWIAIQIITLYFNRKRRLTMYAIRDDLKRVERKLDKVLKKK